MIQKSYYSPFTSEKNEMLSIYEIKFEDLKQLKEKEIEEGFQIEYKSTYNSEVKRKLPKIITSFANEHGGWLFLGIDEDTNEIILVPKIDYEIQIQQIIKSNTSPFPLSFIRFLHPNNNDTEGVVVIWVPEGEDPPYIAKGKIYRRGGSGSDPIKEIEDRFYIDKLYQKSHLNKEKIKNFCKKEISIYNRYWPSGLYANKDYTYMGMCDLYFIPAFGINIYKNKSVKEIADYVINESKQTKTYSANEISFSGNVPLEKYSLSHEAIIFRNSKLLNAHERTLGFELNYNLSAKFHIPIRYVPDKDLTIKKISNIINEDEKILKDFEYIDGTQFLGTVFYCIGLYSYILNHFNEQNQEFMLIIKLSDVRKDVLFFNTPIYENFLKEYGLIFSDKNDYFMPFNYQYTKIELGNLSNILFYITFVSNAFGFKSLDVLKFFIESVVRKIKNDVEK